MAAMSSGMNPEATNRGVDINQHEPLSLLNLVDMALALESQKDHTYAYIKSNEEENAECLLQKERDHNYSYCSKVPLRCRTVQAEPMSQRSSSEENLSRFVGFSSAPRSAPPRGTADDSSLGFLKSRKCHSYETIWNPFLTEHTYSSAVKPPEFVENCQLKTTTDDGEILLCSRSWPNENMFLIPRETSRQSLWKTLPMNYKFDHTYARWQNINGDTNLCVCDDPNCNNSKAKLQPDQVIQNVGTKNDHTYDRAPVQKKTNKSHICESKFKLLNICGNDHNYSGTSDIVPNQTVGSFESLDMELSQSDTDSCDETAQEERKLAITSTISAWLQLRKDHPYSSI